MQIQYLLRHEFHGYVGGGAGFCWWGEPRVSAAAETATGALATETHVLTTAFATEFTRL